MLARLAVASLVAVVACGQGGETPRDDDGVTKQAVLVISRRGGLGAEFNDPASMPEFVVYGDGRVIRARYTARGALPDLQVAQVSEGTVRRIVKEARDAGVDDSGTDYGFEFEAGETVFTLRDDDSVYVVKVSGLRRTESGPHGPTAEQREARRRLRTLVERVGNLNAWLGPDSESAPTDYDFAGLAVIARRHFDQSGAHAMQGRTWTGPDPASAGFITRTVQCMVLAREAWARVSVDVMGTDRSTPWIARGRDRWTFAFRPLLPDEHTCADLART